MPESKWNRNKKYEGYIDTLIQVIPEKAESTSTEIVKAADIEKIAQRYNEQLEDYIWEQKTNEPNIWFHRFTLFRLMGTGRSLIKVFKYEQEQAGEKGGYTAQWRSVSYQWMEQARKWEWHVRASEWDRFRLKEVEYEAHNVFTSGLAMVHVRVDKLKGLAGKVEEYLDSQLTFEGKLSPYIIEQYRGILDDIAKEMGERGKEVRLTGANGGPVQITTEWGRGGSASAAWEKKVDTTPAMSIDEVTETSNWIEREE